MTCPANSYYRICSNICETNCAGLTDHLQCPDNCAEGCQCNDGFFFDGLQCVSLDKCGCFEYNRYFPMFSVSFALPVDVFLDMKHYEPILLNNCSKKCVCSPGGGFICDHNTCSEDETCTVKDGILQCYSKGNISDNWFRVVVGIASCPPDGITAPRVLHVFFKDLFISVNGQNDVWVNGLPVSIPHTATDLVKFSLVGNTLLLSLPQVQVSLSSAGGVKVTINIALSGRVCGACGNFNHDQTDDLKGPGGVNIDNVPDLLTSWTAKDFTPW
ncbi:hypothetical protein JD844_005621 [Phrynosoma platyrhinos]|uniref:VWFD domain-containing protein n=1 Tax=Phrynosoma platyrhinos TaxID=52577 RepID=A0ABQ7TNS3_PHRPL|nr:hypothetical protein JD844_005621 [Phrynosoma platyrhinos]